MKKINIIFISLLTLGIYITKSETVTNNQSKKQSISYILRIQFPQNIKHIPPVCGYYKGYRIEFNKNISVIKETKSNNQFIIVLTPEVKQKIEGINIKYLERIKGKACRLFYLSQLEDVENNISNKWVIEEEAEENLPLRLPEESIVLLMNPNHVECIQERKDQSKSSSISTDQSDEKNLKRDKESVIKLPDIVIKSNLSEQEITASSVYTLLAALDPNAFHVIPEKVSKQERERIVAMQLNR